MKIKRERLAFNNPFHYRPKYYLKHPFEPLGELKRDIVAFWQRGLYGWAKRDTWSYDRYLAKVISEGVGFLAVPSGCPGGFLMDAHKLMEAEGITDLDEMKSSCGHDERVNQRAHDMWATILTDIHYGFKEYIELQDGYNSNKEYLEERNRHVQDIMLTFIEYFEWYWD
jgi:hypothetical protein